MHLVLYSTTVLDKGFIDILRNLIGYNSKLILSIVCILEIYTKSALVSHEMAMPTLETAERSILFDEEVIFLNSRYLRFAARLHVANELGSGN